MRIILAGPRGFCAGVNMAIESLRLALERSARRSTSTTRSSTTNGWSSDSASRGSIFVNDLAEVPEGAHLLYSAHGVSPEVRRQAAERRLQTIDATCPLVTKVHREAMRFAQKGYTIVLIGHAGHDEVVGTMGEAPEAIPLVQTPRTSTGSKCPTRTRWPISRRPRSRWTTPRRSSAACGSDFRRSSGRRGKTSATPRRTGRRRSARLAGEADVVLVVGSQNSSNSQRLAELARSAGVPAHLIDGPADIDLGWFAGDETVMITAGASAPETVVRAVRGPAAGAFRRPVETRTIREERVYFLLPEPLANTRKPGKGDHEDQRPGILPRRVAHRPRRTGRSARCWCA